MDQEFTTLKRATLIAIGVLVVAAVLGALYAWYQFSKVGEPTAEVASQPQATTTAQETDLQASARALREAAAKLQADSGSSSAPATSAQLQASQAALQQATAQQSASGSGPSEAQLEASQKALEAAMQTKSQ